MDRIYHRKSTTEKLDKIEKKYAPKKKREKAKPKTKPRKMFKSPEP